MNERKKKMKDQSGNWVDATIVGVDESTERFSEVKLEDGTILKVKVTAIEAFRLDGQWDDAGNPMYSLKSQTIVTVSESPEKLKRKGQ